MEVNGRAFKKEFRKSRRVMKRPIGSEEIGFRRRRKRRRRYGEAMDRKILLVLGASRTVIILIAFAVLRKSLEAEALRISNFRVPAFVPITLQQTKALDLAKPILFDCDYEYKPEEDARLTIRWFRNKEPEPIYQWLPELNERHFADWIRPLINESFISDPHDPLKRYRSLLIRRLSMNLTGQYTCLVSSLAGQDMRQSSLIVYQPPRAFTFEQRVFPAPAPLVPALRQSPAIGPHNYYTPNQRPKEPELLSGSITRPTQFRSPVVRKPANDGPAQNATSPKIVYTHDGRPVRRKSRSAATPIADWMLQRKLGVSAPAAEQTQGFALQLHHFECKAFQVTPRPVIVLTVKRDAQSIAQYLHESSSTSIRPFQVSQDYFATAKQDEPLLVSDGRASANASSQSDLLVTLYDITVSATVALNVSLPAATQSTSGQTKQAQVNLASVDLESVGQTVNTVLSFRRGQRMSFECHLEITGTEFEQRKRINIKEQEVYQFAELEEEKKRSRFELQQNGNSQADNRGSSSSGSNSLQNFTKTLIMLTCLTSLSRQILLLQSCN